VINPSLITFTIELVDFFLLRGEEWIPTNKPDPDSPRKKPEVASAETDISQRASVQNRNLDPH
jgi:hypothetical protein